MGILTPSSGSVHLHRNLRFGYFSQHHVDQLEMNTTSVELLQTSFPGKICFFSNTYLREKNAHRLFKLQENRLKNIEDILERSDYLATWLCNQSVVYLGVRNPEWHLRKCV